MNEKQINKPRYYLAYGSNLNLAQMMDRCPDASKVGTAKMEDYRLLFKGHDGNCHLTIEPAKGESVSVGVFKISERDETSLDSYEGFPLYYYKKDFEVVLDDGQRIEAFAYIMTDDEQNQPGFPSRAYYERVKEGYADFGFNPDFVKAALEVSVARFAPFGWASRIVDGHIMGFPMTAEEALEMRGMQ